jgi:hypothetical protein
MNINRMKRICQLIAVVIIHGTTLGQQSGQKILFENATVHIGNGEVIQNGLVGVQGNKIILVKNALAFTYNPTDWDSIIQLNGHHGTYRN